MFKIHDDKVYFVAETPDINKVIEIFLPKDDRGTIMDSHEIRVDLCRAVIHMEKKGVRVLKVRNIEDTNKASIDIWHMPEYQEAAESPVSDVVIEITRRCNMCCAHCLRGDAENVDIQERYIDAFLDSFEKGACISYIVFSGGEISLNIPAIRYILKAVKERNISVGSFYMVTNGKAVDKMADLALASLEWWNYCCDKDDDMCGLCISSDNFHEKIPHESEGFFSGLKYSHDDKVTDFRFHSLINEGRAKTINSSLYRKCEPCVEKLKYEINGDDGIDFWCSEMYLNAVGDVVSGCNWSYESQKKYRIGNVMDKNWLDNISDSKWCIAN